MGLWGKLLDASVYFSFDRSGYERHAKDFDPADLNVDLTGRRYAITGANSGIGLATATALAARGARVYLLCRNRQRGNAAARQITAETGNRDVALVLCDVSQPASIELVATALGPEPLVLVHNAGLMPETRENSGFGVEMTAGVHLAGPLLLTTRLRKQLQRVIFVSSGGMYTQKLSLKTLDDQSGAYDGMTAYARTKRGQVVLAEELDKVMDAGVHSMHPGWVDTPAVAGAMPKFYKFTKDRLRTIEQGADTVIWLCAAEKLAGEANGFWFDRARRDTEKLIGKGTSAKARAGLLPLVADWAGVASEWPGRSAADDRRTP